MTIVPPATSAAGWYLIPLPASLFRNRSALPRKTSLSTSNPLQFPIIDVIETAGKNGILADQRMCTEPRKIILDALIKAIPRFADWSANLSNILTSDAYVLRDCQSVKLDLVRLSLRKCCDLSAELVVGLVDETAVWNIGTSGPAQAYRLAENSACLPLWCTITISVKPMRPWRTAISFIANLARPPAHRNTGISTCS